MNPCFRNGLSATPRAPHIPTEGGDLYRGATGHAPFGQSHTPTRVPAPHAGFQTEFGDAPQLYIDGHEKLDDVSTWKMQTIHEVAMSLAENVTHNPALFDLQDQWTPSPGVPQDAQEALDQCYVCSDGDDEEDHEASGAFGGMDSLAAALVPGPARSALPPGAALPRRGKLKMYDWPQQTDPNLEKRRLRAVRQRKQRIREEQQERSLRQELETKKREVAKLTIEAQRRTQNVLMLQKLVAQQKLADQQGHIAF